MDIEDLTKKVNSINYLMPRDYDREEEKFMYDFIDKLLTSLKNIDEIDEFTFKKCLRLLERELKPKSKIKYYELNYFARKMFTEYLIFEDELNLIKKYIKTKKVRSQSGILEIAIMTSPGNFSCAYDCYYCPNQKDMPRSYIKEEPAVKRAAANDFDAVKQFYDRATTYSLNGHDVDKIELIILGGTWSSYPYDYQKLFIRDLYFAANTFYLNNEDKDRERLSIEEEQEINENSMCHIVGLTLETRPDSITPEELIRFNYFGVTRVQLGIQHTDNTILKKINRQSTVEDSMNALKLLKDCGFKIMIHIMPNLPYSSPEKDMIMFERIISSHDLQADEWKIYPTSVTTTSTKDIEEVNTVIEKWYKDGKYIPYSTDELYDVLIYAKTRVPRWIRIARIFRDIPLPNITGGANVPNMRQVIKNIMETMNEECHCIRCREIKDRTSSNKVEFKKEEYYSSGGKEIFITAEKEIDGKYYILGFLRLRLSEKSGKDSYGLFMPQIKNCALIREVHVYGKLQSCYNKKNNSNNQHYGIGKNLINYAEFLAYYEGYRKISVTSGVGVRNYYRKQGYYLKDGYTVKKLYSLFDSVKDYFSIIMIIFVVSTCINIFNKLMRNLNDNYF